MSEHTLGDNVYEPTNDPLSRPWLEPAFPSAPFSPMVWY
jgi:hypothetical protein